MIDSADKDFPRRREDLQERTSKLLVRIIAILLAPLILVLLKRYGLI